MLLPKNYHYLNNDEQIQWYRKDYDERKKIVVESYIPDYVNENNELDIYKLVERFLYLEERVDELENICERVNNDY